MKQQKEWDSGGNEIRAGMRERRREAGRIGERTDGYG